MSGSRPTKERVSKRLGLKYTADPLEGLTHEAERAGMLEDDRAVLTIGLIERDARVRQAQQSGQTVLTVLDGLLSNILAIHFQQIERDRMPLILAPADHVR